VLKVNIVNYCIDVLKLHLKNGFVEIPKTGDYFYENILHN